MNDSHCFLLELIKVCVGVGLFGLGSLLKQFEEDTRKESEKFKIEMKSELEKIVSEFVLPP